MVNRTVAPKDTDQEEFLPISKFSEFILKLTNILTKFGVTGFLYRYKRLENKSGSSSLDHKHIAVTGNGKVAVNRQSKLT